MSLRSASPLVLGALVAALPVAALALAGSTKVYVPGWVHVWAVGTAAAVATAAALALVVAGALAGDGRSVVVGCAFSLMAALLCLHGATTPGVFFDLNGVVALTGALTLPVGCAVLAAGALPSWRERAATPAALGLLAVGVAAVLLLGTSAVLWPTLVPAVPEPGSAPALALLVLGLALCAWLASRAVRTYLLTRRPGDLAVGIGIAWFAPALYAALVYDYWRVGWWVGHGVEIAAIALVGVPIALDLRRSTRSHPLIGDLRAAQLVRAEEEYLGSQVRALLVALAAKDEYTEEHTRRVALRAVQVAEELRLPPWRLRDLAVGGLLHDIGKLALPDAILKKPGPLTDAEYADVQTHPAAGSALLARLGGFSPEVRAIVRGHHERLDGCGYPDGLAGADVALDVRILAVCDVYDALLSARVYRPAWDHDRALALLRREAGTAFDPRCVEALARVVAREAAAPGAAAAGRLAVAV
jgi:hypothetical protein